MSATCSGTPGGRLSRDPLERSSSTSTRWPAATSPSTIWLPMNPAPPVTRMFMVSVPNSGRKRRPADNSWVSGASGHRPNHSNGCFPVVFRLGTMRPADCLTLLDRRSTMYTVRYECREYARSAVGCPPPIPVPGTFSCRLIPCRLRFSGLSLVRALVRACPPQSRRVAGPALRAGVIAKRRWTSSRSSNAWR